MILCRFREISKSVYSLEIQPVEDMVLVQVPENVTTDVAGNKNLASNTLQLLHCMNSFLHVFLNLEYVQLVLAFAVSQFNSNVNWALVDTN